MHDGVRGTLSADREVGLRSAALAGLTDAPQVSGWALPRRRPSKGNEQVPITLSEERHVVRVCASHGVQNKEPQASRVESDPLGSNAPVRCWHEGRRERPPLKRELDEDSVRAAYIWRRGRRKPVSAHVAEAVSPGAQVERSIPVANRDRRRFIRVSANTVAAQGEDECRASEDRSGPGRARHSVAHRPSTITNHSAFQSPSVCTRNVVRGSRR